MITLSMAAPESRAPSDAMKRWFTTLRDHGILKWSDQGAPLIRCLPTLLAALGWAGDIRALADALPHGRIIFERGELLQTLALLGYRSESEQLSLAEIPNDDLPALFLPDNQTAKLLLLSKRDGGFDAFDPRTEQPIRVEATARRGEVIKFKRLTPAEQEANEQILSSRHWFRGTMRRFAPIFWHAGLISLMVHVITLAVPLYVMLVYDRVINARSDDTLLFLLGGVAIALAFEGGLRSLRTRLVAWFGARISTLVNAAMFERLMLLSPTYAEQAPIASQLARIKAFEAVRDFFTGPMFQTILEFPFTIVLIVAIAFIAGPVAWVPVGVIAAYAVMAFAFRPYWRERSQVAARTASERQQLAMETADKWTTLHSAGMTERWAERLTSASLKASRAHYAFARTTTTIEHLSYMMTVLGGVATILFSIERIWAGEMTPGALVATMIITWRVLYPLQIAHAMLPHLEQVWQSVDQVNQLMLLKPERHMTAPQQTAHSFSGGITFTQVGLRYGRQRDPVLAGIGFQLEVGEHLAIYGANGTGKSSILKLAAGMHMPQAGSVRLDGIDLRQIDPAHVRRHVSYLPQIPEFFAGTLLENLRMRAPLATEEEIRNCLTKADAWSDVQALEQGWLTLIGPGKTALPTGLLARLNLARFYIDLQNILLIDELPYALLNTKAGETFRQFLKEQHGVRTALFVTHREDFARAANRILWLQQDRRAFLTTPAQLDSLERSA